MLCVLLAHAWLLFVFLRLGPAPERAQREMEIAAITLFSELPPEASPAPRAPSAHAPAAGPRPTTNPAAASPAAPVAEPGVSTAPGRVDWPIEGKRSAARVLAAEAEAARVAKMFSGPGGTWASLTPREKSRLKKFRWKPGVDGLEYDEHGNAIYHISPGCVVVNLLFIGCALGQDKVHGDLFEDMRLYFDEQRLPPLDTGNGDDDAARR